MTKASTQSTDEAEGPVESADPVGADDAGSTESGGGWPRAVLIVALVLAVATAGLAIWYGVAWLRAGNDDSLEFSRTRDEVNRVGQAAIVTFHTLDYRKVDEGLTRWENASTGTLHDEVVSRRDSSKQAIEAAKTVTEATILSASVTELDDRGGQATMIAAVKVVVTPEGKQPEAKYMRIQAAMQRAGEDWKLSGIGQVQFAPAG